MPADSLTSRKRRGRLGDQGRIIYDIKFCARILQAALDVVLRIGRAEVAALHRVRFLNARLLLAIAAAVVITGESRAERAAGIARGGLDENALEFSVTQNFAIRDAIQRDAASEAEIFLAGFRSRRARQA